MAKMRKLMVAGAACLAASAGLATPTVSHSAAQSARGEIGYAAHCARCHGAAMGGGGAPTLTGAFWSTWKGRSLGELLGLIQGSMPADEPASLDDKAYADILAYMMEKGGYPAGASELPASPKALETVQIGAQP
ncbi:cytochrome c [Sphingobium aquiterrae]|uniref:cytochrome c n=1 Tax=Sphingobium aquiterrae TaxID=2038656 RepID=UPI003019B7CA